VNFFSDLLKSAEVGGDCMCLEVEGFEDFEGFGHGCGFIITSTCYDHDFRRSRWMKNSICGESLFLGGWGGAGDVKP
jgi:hypothetical protein